MIHTPSFLLSRDMECLSMTHTARQGYTGKWFPQVRTKDSGGENQWTLCLKQWVIILNSFIPHEINEEIFAPEFKIEKLEGEITGEKR